MNKRIALLVLSIMVLDYVVPIHVATPTSVCTK